MGQKFGLGMGNGPKGGVADIYQRSGSGAESAFAFAQLSFDSRNTQVTYLLIY